MRDKTKGLGLAVIWQDTNGTKHTHLIYADIEGCVRSAKHIKRSIGEGIDNIKENNDEYGRIQ